MDLTDVIAHAARLGPIMYLATVAPAGGPHVVPVHVDWHEGAAWCVTGMGDVKTRNVMVNPSACLHSTVSEDTGWDHLIVWGQATLLSDTTTKQRLWTGVFSYDLHEFAPGGPHESPDTGFLRIEPDRVVLLRRYGFDGRDQWRA